VYVKQPTGFPPPFDSLLVPITNNKLVEKQQRLEGQPRFYANVAIGYDIGGLSARLSLFYQAEYNYSFSASGLSDQVIDPYTRLDLALKYQFSDHVAMMFSVSNLTDVEESNSIINRSTGWKLLNTSERYGRTADLGIRVSL
jgi:outer membrane receptor protein involved in Fe transport